MEVEFLSNMRYSLYTTEAEWKRWHVKLSKFWEYFDRASNASIQSTTSNTALPSPPGSTQSSPPFVPSIVQPTPPPSQHPLSMPPYLPPPIPANSMMPELDLRSVSRKRAADDYLPEPSAKRMTGSQASSAGSSATMPSSSIPTPSLTQVSSVASSQRIPQMHVPPTTNQLPQLSSGQMIPPYPLPPARAMSLVYNNANANTQPRSGYQQPASRLDSMLPNHLTLAPVMDNHHRQPPSHGGSATNSPTTHLPANLNLSPSYFLQNRNSPYRPIRRVDTLLHPPPSASIHADQRSLSHDQMHYLPLGRPMTERRTGVVPYAQPYRDVWQHPPPSAQQYDGLLQHQY